MIPTGRGLFWALWLILGTRAVKARVLVQSRPGADWAGGSEGNTITARIPNKVWPNIVKRDESGLVRKAINPEEEEEDKLAATAAIELLEDSIPVSENEQKDCLEEGRELDGDEQQKEDQENDEDLAQEDNEDQDQELNQKEEQKKHSRDPGQDRGQAQKIKQVQNPEQGEIQEIEGEEQPEQRGEEKQGRGEAQELMQGLEEQRQGQGEEGQGTDEEAGGLEEQSLGHELEQTEVQKRVKEQQQPIQDQRQEPQIQVQEQPQAPEPQQVQVQEQPQAQEQAVRQQEQPQIQEPLEGAQLPLPPPPPPPPPPPQEQGLVRVQAPAPTPGQPAQEQLLLKASEQAILDLSLGPGRNDSGFFPSLGLPLYEPQQQPPAELELSNTGPVPPPEMHLVMLAWGPWECHCPTGTMSRVRGGKFLGFTGRLRSGALSRLQTQRQPCTYARCHCNQEKKECPSDHVSCPSTPGACNPRASLTPLGSPENTINETVFWKQVREGLEEVWVGLQNLATNDKRIKRNQR